MNSTPYTTRQINALRRTTLKWVFALFLVLGAAAPALAAPPSPVSAVPFERALGHAQRLTDMHYDWSLFQVRGDSMAPQFGNTSLLVTAAANYETLAPGMLVIYQDKDGDLVAHRLVEQTPAGWTAKGLNNDRMDPGLVTRENLKGVVFGILHYKAGTEAAANVATIEAPKVAYAKKY